jgi:hypothetical protein
MKISILCKILIISLVANLCLACVNINTNQIKKIWQRKNENLALDLEDYFIGTGIKYSLESSLNPNVEVRDTVYVENRSKNE